MNPHLKCLPGSANCSIPIIIRSLEAKLPKKHSGSCIVALSPDGKYTIPLLDTHSGANELATCTPYTTLGAAPFSACTLFTALGAAALHLAVSQYEILSLQSQLHPSNLESLYILSNLDKENMN